MFSRMSGARILGALVVLLATVLVSYAPSPAQSLSGTSRHRHDPAIIRERHGRNATSTNWSGYAVTGADGSVTDVKGSWIVPAVICHAGAPDSYSSLWVGIDGFTSSTVEQIGIDADCVSGTPEYFAWFEFYPHWPYTINTVEVQPGDTISAEVSYGAKAVHSHADERLPEPIIQHQYEDAAGEVVVGGMDRRGSLELRRPAPRQLWPC